MPTSRGTTGDRGGYLPGFLCHLRVDGWTIESARVSRCASKNHEEIVPSRDRILLAIRHVGERVRNNAGPDLISLQVIFRTDRKCARSPICLAASLA